MSVRLSIQGAAPNANDPHEVVATLHDIPRVGDQVDVWLGGLEGQVFLKVEEVTWPTWRFDHDPDQTPKLWLRRPDEMTDEEWAGVFAAIKEDRRP